METLVTPNYRKLTAEEIGGKVIKNPIFTETITVTNPYNHTTWEEAIVPDDIILTNKAVIIVADGVQMIVSKSYSATLRSQGAYAPHELDSLE